MKFRPVTFSDERRLKSASRWKRIDAGQSPSGAIAEFCRNCMQTNTHVADCTSVGCPLFPYRPGADRDDAVKRRDGIDVPSQSDYDSLIAVWHEEHPEAIARAIAMQSGKQDVFDDVEEANG